MKKIMIFAAFAAALSLASCQKEGLNEVVKNDPSAVSESPVFTGTINAGTKTTVDAASGKVSWETTDEITVADKDQKTAVYSIESIDGTTGRAKFVYKSGDALGEGPYTATYGTEPATAQTYAATPGNLYMTAQSETTSLTFSVQCGLMEINLTKAEESVKSIAVTGTPTGGSETTYTLTCTEAQSIESTKSFYISVAAGSYNKIVITDSEDKVCTLTASGITVTANYIKPLTFAGNKLNFKSNLPAGALPGEFSVSATKKVYFSKGNLWADGNNALHFEDAQWKTTPASNGSKNASHVSHFIWSDKVPDAVGNFYSGSNLFCDEANKQSVDGSGKIYYALSTNEWQYLFKTRTMEKGGARYEYLTSSGITVEGVTFKGVVLFSDDFTEQKTWKETYTTWKALNDAGVVFLPAAGYRVGFNVNNVGGYGYYWSSTALGGSDAYCVSFESNDVSPDRSGMRSISSSVRLITECQ